MLEENLEIEKSIVNAKVMAREKQPIRHDVYLQHLGYYESCIETLKKIIKNMKSEETKPQSQVNYFFTIQDSNKKHD